MRKTILAASLASSLCFSGGAAVTAEKPIDVVVDGQKLDLTVPPILQNGNTLVPFRPVFEALGLSVDWDGPRQTVIGKNEKFRLELQIDSLTAMVGGKLRTLETAPLLVEGQTFVPLRFVGETMGREVRWDDETRTVHLRRPGDIDWERLTYEGDMSDGKRNGTGKLFADGLLVYEGDFRNDHMEGNGKLYWGQSVLYEGEFKQSKFDGYGKKYYSNGKLMYEGYFAENKMHGRGKLYRDDGTLWYDATFVKERIEGPGTVYFSYGHRLEVSFIDGSPDGKGTYYYGGGWIQYIGDYRNGRRNGTGTTYFPSGSVMYEGEFVDSDMTRGKFYYESGKLRYEGEFKNKLPHGNGIEYNEDGTVSHKGLFDQGNPVKTQSSQ